MDKEWFTENVLDAEKSMYHVAKSILREDEDCADAMQNAILSAWKNLPALKNRAYFKTWMIRILMNECYRQIRSRKNTVSYEEYIAASEDKASGQAASCRAAEEEYFTEQYSEVFREIMKLDRNYRLPFVLHYAEGYSLREVAEILDISEGAVKTRLSRGRNMLRDRLKGAEGYEKCGLE